MSACEHCWGRRYLLGVEYHEVIAMAEREGWPCTKDTIEGARLRAGQWWDESKQRDSRDDILER